MSNLIRPVVQELKNFFVGIVPEVQSQVSGQPDRFFVGFGDERIKAVNEYPRLIITLYDAVPDRGAQTGAHSYIVKDTQAGTGEVHLADKPMRLYFQLDVYCKKISDDWVVNERLQRYLILHHKKLITADGRELFIVPESFNVLDELEDFYLYRKDYRFYAVVWYDYPDEITTVQLIQDFNVLMNDVNFKLN